MFVSIACCLTRLPSSDNLAQTFELLARDDTCNSVTCGLHKLGQSLLAQLAPQGRVCRQSILRRLILLPDAAWVALVHAQVPKLGAEVAGLVGRCGLERPRCRSHQEGASRCFFLLNSLVVFNLADIIVHVVAGYIAF